MYNLNVEAAKKADSIGAFISDTGKYEGTFLRAEKLISNNKGTHGIGFTFKSAGGQECRFDIWTQKADGENLSGMNQVNALMACLQVRSLTEKTMRVKKWDSDQGKEDMMDATCFPELMNKTIGLLLRSEEYEKMKDGHLTGDTGWRMGMFACFQAGTELMASEILDRKTQPEQLAKVVMMLADKPLKKAAKTSARAAASHDGGIPDDYIPF